MYLYQLRQERTSVKPLIVEASGLFQHLHGSGKETRPMIYVSIRNTVADYAKWRPIFDADEPNRRAQGASGVQHIFRDQANPNDVTGLLEWNNVENAQKFLHDPALAETMKGGGVTNAPEVRFLNRS
jgi:hypothetical protein